MVIKEVDLPEDTYKESDTILAGAVEKVLTNLMDEKKLPYLGSIPHQSSRRYKRKLAILCGYPTPLIGRIIKNNLVIDSAVDNSKPGGRVKIILEALRALSGQPEQKEPGIIGRWLGRGRGDR